MNKILVLIAATLLPALSASAAEPIRPGASAPDFNLKNVKGEMISLSKINDAKGFIVVFYCNTCPVAKKYEQRIVDLHNEFSSKGYPVIAINSNDKFVSPGDSYEEMQKLAKTKGYGFEYLYDETQEVARNYGATNTPHVYVLSKRGNNLTVDYVGAIDNNSDDASMADKKYVSNAVNALLKGEPVPVNGTRAVGCSIKWRKA
jgi:peroxiredoxin